MQASFIYLPQSGSKTQKTTTMSENTEPSSFSLCNKKSPIKIFPLQVNRDSSNSQHSETIDFSFLKQEANPSLSRGNSILDLSDCSDIPSVSTSQNDSGVSSVRRPRIKLRLSVNRGRRDSSTVLQPIQTDTNQRANSARAHSNSATPIKVKSSVYPSSAQCPSGNTDTSSHIQVSSFNTISNNESDKLDSARSLLPSSRRSSLGGVSSKVVRVTNNTPYVDNQNVVRKFAKMRVRSSSPCTTHRRSLSTEPETHSSLYNTRNTFCSTQYARAGLPSPLSSNSDSTKTTPQASPCHNLQPRLKDKAASVVRAPRRKSEAYFWDPSSANDMLPTPSFIKPLECAEKPAATKATSIRSAQEGIIASSWKERKNDQELLHAYAKTVAQPSNKECLLKTTREGNFAALASERDLVMEQSLSNFLKTSELQERFTTEKSHTDINELKTLLSLTKLRESTANLDEVLSERFRRRQTAVMSDTQQSSTELRKLTSRSSGSQFKAFTPRINEMPKNDDTDWTLQFSESRQDSEETTAVAHPVRTRACSPNLRTLNRTSTGKKTTSTVQFPPGTLCTDSNKNTSELPEDFNGSGSVNFQDREHLQVYCINCQSHISSALIDEHSLVCIATTLRRLKSTDRSTAPLINETIARVNEHIQVVEEQMIVIIEKAYNFSDPLQRSEQTQIFIDEAAEAVVRTAHLKISNQAAAIVEKDATHLQEILERLRGQSELSSNNSISTLDEVETDEFSFHLQKVVELANSKQQLLKSIYHTSCDSSSKQRTTQSLSNTELTIKSEWNPGCNTSNSGLKLIAEASLDAEMTKVVEDIQSMSVSIGSEGVPTRNVIRGETKPLRIRLGTSSRSQSVDSKRSLSNSMSSLNPKEGNCSQQEFEQLKEQFGKLAVRLKNQLPETHQAHNLITSDLFEEAFEQCISQNKWVSFIRQRYEESEKSVF